MIIRKFGGTSVGTPSRMKEVAEIISGEENQLIVLSAISGITNWLESISAMLFNNEINKANIEIEKMFDKYVIFVDELLQIDEFKAEAIQFLESRKNFLLNFGRETYTLLQEKDLLSDGEIVSTVLFQLYLKEQNVNVQWLSALTFMRIDKNQEPDEFYIYENINRELEKYPQVNLFVTQGYICRNAYGEVDNLKRGGSDYSATLIGSAINTHSVEIWTDIDGIHNNDPRFVENTNPINSLSFDEAAELAYFGAKILHPSSLQPAKKKNIPVYLKNTMAPHLPGTIISNEINSSGIKAVAAKDNITVIRIRSGRMLNAYGFLRKVFEVFEVYKTPIDMITTSEVAISVTIDNDHFLKDIVQDLNHFCEVDYEQSQTIIAIVGIIEANKKGYAAQVFDALSKIPVKMISYGASEYNISILLDCKYKQEALQSIQSKFFQK